MTWRLIGWVIWDLIRHPVRNIRGFRAAFNQGYDLARQGYRPVVEDGELTFQRRVGTYTRQPDGSWTMEEHDGR